MSVYFRSSAYIRQVILARSVLHISGFTCEFRIFLILIGYTILWNQLYKGFTRNLCKLFLKKKYNLLCSSYTRQESCPYFTFVCKGRKDTSRLARAYSKYLTEDESPPFSQLKDDWMAGLRHSVTIPDLLVGDQWLTTVL